MSTYAFNLNEVREGLLREYISATKEGKAELLTKIMDLDEEIEGMSN